ncbi:hypothetical protein ACHWQZ_G000982 [Mnemiopsis leidyi]
MSSHSLDVPANQQVHNKAATEIRFVSKKLSVGVVNTYNKDTILLWLSQCGIAASSKNKVHKLRTKLLKYIQNIHEGKERPKISFVSSFLEKITYPQLRDEAKRLKIHIPKRALEPEARRIINHYFVTERNASLNPPLLISTDEELSSSETDSEDSWDEEPEKPQITKSKAVPIKRNNNNANSIDTKCKTLTKKNVLGKKVGNMSKNPTEDLLDRKTCDTVRGKLTAVIPNPSATEIQIKSLEKTLLGFQSKLQHQETAIETIANRTNLNISPSEETSKKIKAIESKIKCLFENLNAQKNSVDNLSDCIKDGKKDKKRTQDKLSQIQALAKEQSEQNEEKSHELNSRLQSLIQHNIQYDQVLAQVKSGLDQVMHSIKQIVDVVDGIKVELDDLKLKQLLSADAEKTQASKHHTQPFQQQVNGQDILIEMEKMKLEHMEQLNEIKNMLVSYRLETTSRTTPNQKTRVKPQPPVVMPYNFWCQKEQNDKLHNKRLMEASRTKQPSAPEPAPKTKVENNSKPELRQNQPKQPAKNTAPTTKQLTATTGQSCDLTDESRQSGKTNDPKSLKITAHRHHKNNETMTQQKQKHGRINDLLTEESNPRESYRRERRQSESKNIQSSSPNHRPNDNQQNLSEQKTKHQKTDGNISIDSPFLNQPRYRREKFTTRKCVILHDPYFDKFEKKTSSPDGSMYQL